MITCHYCKQHSVSNTIAIYDKKQFTFPFDIQHFHLDSIKHEFLISSIPTKPYWPM